MTTYDTGTPHYCTSRARPDGSVQGCPLWPECLFPQSAERVATAVDDATAERLAHVGLTATTERGSGSTLGRDLATLAGWAVGAVIFLVVAGALLPLFI